MSNINRVDYRKKSAKIPHFEIVDLQLFFATRPKKLLEKDSRLNFWAIIYVTEGTGRHYIDFEEFEYCTGDIIFIKKNQVHRFDVDSSAKGYIIHINEPFLLDGPKDSDVFLEFINRIYGVPVISVDNSFQSSNRKLIEMIYTEYNRGSAQKQERLMKSLFDSFMLALQQRFEYKGRLLETGSCKIFTEFKELVEEHFDKHLNMDDYSRMMGVSKKSINQSTRRTVDLSAKEFVNERLFLEIKRYLSQGNLLNYEIAEIVGFDEPANMSKFFKKHEGVSPKEFKERLNI